MITRAARAFLAAGFLAGCVSVFAQSHAPAIVTQPQGRFLNLGLPVSFNVSASGSAPLSYQWQRNGTNLVDGGNVSGSASTNLSLSSTGTNDGGGYTVIVANKYGSVTSTIANLTLILPCQPNSPSQPPRYTAIDLGNLGGTFSDAIEVNNNGHVAGWGRNSASYPNAFLYSDGTMSNLGSLGGLYASAASLNDGGQVVGQSSLSGDADWHAFFYSDGVMTDLGTLPGDTDSEAYGINNMGQVVGYSYTNNGPEHAFLYSNGMMTDVGTLPGGGFGSWAYGINDAGEVVGGSSTSGGSQHAFLYSNGTMVDLGTLDGTLEGLTSSANAINNKGQIVGYSDITNASEFTHAFLYSNGTMTDLGPPGSPESEATCINNRGQIVGWYSTIDFNDNYVFLYSNGELFDLNSLLGTYTIPLGAAYGINDSGQIAASTLVSIFVSDGYLLTPVPPGYNAEFDLATATNANPNGPWTYSWSSLLDAAQTLYSTNIEQGTNDLDWTGGWLRDPSNAVPFVAVNNYAIPSGIWPPNTLGFAPGANGEFSHVIWIAPASGAYSVSNTFTMLDTGSVAVCIVQRPTNGAAVHLVSTNVSAASTNFTYTATLLFNAGDQLDFAVGGGTNTPLLNTTALSPSIAPLPSASNLGFSLTNAQVASGSFLFSWVPLITVPPVSYQVQYATNPVSGTWNNLGATIVATGSLLSVTNALTTDPQRFYRVLMSQ